MDPVSLIKKRERILETKVTRRKYYLLVEMEETRMAAAVMKSQTKGSHGILKPAENLKCQKQRLSINRPKIGKG